MKCENSCVYTGRNEKYYHKEVKSVPTHIKRDFRNRMIQIHFHSKIPSSSNIQGLMQTSSYKILQLQNITMYWIQVFWSFYFRLHKNLHQQEIVPDKKNIAIISAPFLWRHLFRYWHPKSRFLSNLTFFTHYLKWTHNLIVLELTINGYHQ